MNMAINHRQNTEIAIILGLLVILTAHIGATKGEKPPRRSLLGKIGKLISESSLDSSSAFELSVDRDVVMKMNHNRVVNYNRVNVQMANKCNKSSRSEPPKRPHPHPGNKGRGPRECLFYAPFDADFSDKSANHFETTVNGAAFINHTYQARGLGALDLTKGGWIDIPGLANHDFDSSCSFCLYFK